MHPRDGALPGEARLDPHQHRVAPAVHVEHFLAGESDLHGPARELGELARRDLVGERVELAAESAAHRRRHHPDMRLRHVEDLAEEAMDVVRRLRGRPQGELAVGSPVRHRRVLLHGQVGVPLEEEHVLANEVRAAERRLHVTELERHRLVDVGAVAVLVDAHVRIGQRLLDGHEGLERLVFDVDEPGRPLRRLLVDRGHCRHRVPDHPDLVHAQRFLVLGDGKNAEFHPRQVVPGDDGVDTGQRPGAHGVDALDEGVRVRASQQLGVGHAGQDEIVGEPGLARDLGPRVDLGQRLADHRKLARAHALAPFIRSAASSTASRIFV